MPINLKRQPISQDTKLVIEEFMKIQRYYNINDALDAIGYRLKIRAMNIWVFDEIYGHTGFVSAIEFFEGNPIDGLPKEVELKFFRNSRSAYDKCCDCTAKHYLPILDSIPNLRSLVFKV